MLNRRCKRQKHAYRMMPFKQNQLYQHLAQIWACDCCSEVLKWPEKYCHYYYHTGVEYFHPYYTDWETEAQGKEIFIRSPSAIWKGRPDPRKPLPAPVHTLHTWQESTPHSELAHSMSFPMNFFWPFKKRNWYRWLQILLFMILTATSWRL